MNSTFTVRGHRVRSRSNRRFILVQVYPAVTPIGEEKRTGVDIFKRSDSVATLKREIQRQGFWAGRTWHIIDTLTGEELS